MYKLQFFRTSAPTPLHDTAAEAAAEEAEAAAAFASTGASAGQQAIWRSTYRWLRGLDGVGEVEESVEALAVQLSEGETEPERVVSPDQTACRLPCLILLRFRNLRRRCCDTTRLLELCASEPELRRRCPVAARVLRTS